MSYCLDPDQDILSVLIWIQTVYKGDMQTIKIAADKEIIIQSLILLPRSAVPAYCSWRGSSYPYFTNGFSHRMNPRKLEHIRWRAIENPPALKEILW